MSFLSTLTGVAVIDTRTRPGIITLPLTLQIPNRYLQFKDLYGAFGRSSLTISTQGGESFDDGTTSKVFNDPFTFLQLYAASTTKWSQLGGTQTIQQTVSSLNVSSLTIGSGLGWLQLPPVQTVALSTNTINADTIITNSTTSMYVSAQILYVSSIMGAVVGAGNIATSNITSTVAGLGSSGYLSSLNSRTISTGNVSLSSLTLIDGNTGALNSLFVSSGLLRFNTSTLNAIYPSNYVCQGRLTADQTITPSADTVLPFVSDFDPQGWLANSGTNTARFQPTIAGYYIVSYQVWWGAGTGTDQNNIQIRKGGNSIAISQEAVPTTTGLSMNTTKMAYLNGTTDYLDFSVYSATSGVSQLVQYGGTTNGPGTFFSASLVTGGTGSGGGGGGTGDVTSANLVSTVQGLGSANYVSTLSLNSTVRGLGSASYISTLSLNSTIQGLGTYGFLSSVSGATGFVSSLTVNALTLGSGAGWLQLPPVQTIYASTTYTQAQNLITVSSYFGAVSTLNTIDFYGLFGNYNNTVLAEVSTGAGTQEFLVFKGSSASDRVRFQTTGNFVVETGVSARLWDDTTIRTLSNATPAFIINTSSNVGIQTASPGATLDVAGTARAQTLSSLALNFSSINGSLPLGITNITSTVRGLGSSGYLSSIPAVLGTSTITASTITTSSLQVASLTIGTGTGWVNLGPIQAVAVSSLQENTNALYAANGYIGITSTVNALTYNGLFGNYNNTALAEISTGAGTQEFLVFKGSSASDRIRFQTTGNFVIETGVSSRLFNSNTLQTLSNATPAFVVNTSSNVGIQTASPGATLDVAGTGRFQTLSSLALNISSINGSAYTPGGGGSIDYVSAFTVSTSFVQTSTLSSFVMNTYGIFGSAFLNLGPDDLNIATGATNINITSASNLNLTANNDINLSNTTSTITNTNSLYMGSSNEARIVSQSNIYLETPYEVITSSIYSYGTVSTHSLVVYGPSTLTVQGLAYFQNTISSYSLVTGGLGVIDSATGQPTYIQVANGTFDFGGVSSITEPNLTSTVAGLGQIYLSTGGAGGVSQIVAGTNITLSPPEGTGVVTINATGGGGGITSLPDNISTVSLSTISLYANGTYIGASSDESAIQFYGTSGNYNNSVIAEISTGGVSQEMLFFKGNSALDRFRFQTTGNFVVETGVSSRLFASTTVNTLSNATPAFIIDSASNVGIQTASPATALDVVGTGRFVTMSSLQVQASSIVTNIFTTNIFAVAIQTL